VTTVLHVTAASDRVFAHGASTRAQSQLIRLYDYVIKTFSLSPSLPLSIHVSLPKHHRCPFYTYAHLCHGHAAAGRIDATHAAVLIPCMRPLQNPIAWPFVCTESLFFRPYRKPLFLREKASSFSKIYMRPLQNLFAWPFVCNKAPS